MRNLETGVDQSSDIFMLRYADNRTELPPQQYQSWPSQGGNPIIGSPFKWYFLKNDDAPILTGPQYQCVQDDISNMTFTEFSNVLPGHPSGNAKIPWKIVEIDKDAQLYYIDMVYAAVISYFYPQKDYPVRQSKINAAQRSLINGTMTVEDELIIAQDNAFYSTTKLLDLRKAELIAAVNSKTPYDIFEGWQLERTIVEGLLSNPAPNV